MTKNELKRKYFDWMTRLVSDGPTNDFYNLMAYLHTIEFKYILERDENRMQDGIELRYRFAYANEVDPYLIDEYLFSEGCSVFEMMVALANKCEESIMDNPEFGNRQYRWFLAMIDSLGLSDVHDYDMFDYVLVNNIIEKFLNREYSENGKGGLYTVSKPPKDMRDVEIWYQMCWYIDELIEFEEGGV